MPILNIHWHGNVVHVELNRPERLNALNNELIQALVDAGDELSGRRDCRVVVISGAGRAFCSGIDLDALQASSQGGDRSIDLRSTDETGANIAQKAALQWQSLSMPVLAAVHGFAYGGGLQIALGADMRIMSPDARMGLVEVKWGMLPDMGGMAMLPSIVKADVMADLILTGRVFDGVEAHRLGIATRLASDPFSASMEIAQTIARISPDAVRAAKRVMRMPQERSAVLRAEAREAMGLVGQPNQRESMSAAREKREPIFVD